MLVVNREIIVKFCSRHPLSRKPLEQWLYKAEMADWDKFIDVRATFNSADYVNGEYIFNIHGNSYRLYAEIIFEAKTLIVLEILTHAGYDKKNKRS